ncbi:S41 family peptidase [Enterocloster bolteae]|uniref:S41 family peptidase n=1 Tax=Enterocloster bolteae TaxID=208479 RepID=UPI0034C0A91B
MKKKTDLKQAIFYVICAAVIISNPTTVSANNEQTAVEDTGEQQPSLRQEIQKLKKGNWVNLTTEQKLEDLDILYQTLKDNYPYFHVLKRMRNVDLNEKYRTARKEISKGGTDIAFYQQMDAFINTNDQIGHLMLDNPYWYEDSASSYKRLAEDYPDMERMQKFSAAYNNDKSVENYRKMKNITDPAYNKVMAYYNAAKTAQDTGRESAADNVQTRIIEEGRIAYIKIDSLLPSNAYGEDKKQLFDFYKTVKDYDNVIFDFTDNGGGSMNYFNDLIVSPNIEVTLKCNGYKLIKAGENNGIFLDFNDYRPISEFPGLPQMNPDDLSDMDLFHEIEYTSEPSGKEKMLKGKLWLLVSDTVFSSSEYAAMFSKATGFMTLVGTRTSGEGIGSDPLPIILPNSGLIVQYAAEYGALPDGSGSQEYGTMPDILSPEGESALDTCLKAIEQQQQP